MTRNQKIVLISTVAVVAALPAIALVRAIKEKATPMEEAQELLDNVMKSTEK